MEGFRRREHTRLRLWSAYWGLDNDAGKLANAFPMGYVRQSLCRHSSLSLAIVEAGSDSHD